MPQETGFPQWAKLIRRIMTDDSQGQSQFAVIYHMIVRHSNLFYASRGLFIPQLIQSLGKLIVPSPTSNAESRILLLDITETIWTWEKLTHAEQSDPPNDCPDAMDIDHSTSPSLLTHSQRELVVSYLARLVVAHIEPAYRTAIVNRSLVLLSEMLEPQYWSDVQVKLAFFSRAFDQVYS
jgi:transformation/transcription domain-associated protein